MASNDRYDAGAPAPVQEVGLPDASGNDNFVAGEGDSALSFRPEWQTAARYGSDTPDFLLGDYLMCCLDTWEQAIEAREVWYGRKASEQ